MKHVKLFEEFVNESNDIEPINELSLTSAGVRSFLRAMYTNADVINKLGFKSFKDLVGYIKSNGLEDWDELRDEAREFGLVVTESVVNEDANLPKGLEQMAADEKAEGKKAEIYLAKFTGKTFKAQSTNKVWDDGVPVTKNFTRGGYKSVTIKGEHYIIEGDTFWYFRVGDMWYAVKMADYGTPPFEY